MIDDMAVYIANLGKYNEGYLVGAWFTFPIDEEDVFFLVGCFLAFATGTSWGTFGILIPIVVAVFQGTNETMMIISISACMAGAVCGDHCSPISDTTIMASAGAQCNHVNHVTTQLPYAATVAVVSCITYVIAGFVQNALICLPIGMVLLAAALLFMKKRTESHS